MGDKVAPGVENWREWRRVGDYVVMPPGTTTADCFAVTWELTCEKYGMDPQNPPPLRRDILTIVRHPQE
ncbi:MAG TPA: hypothetical protein VFQ45_15085 [Longimicrobium sp.]|nr:hypothetical protein [Longimicrobium sp.]